MVKRCEEEIGNARVEVYWKFLEGIWDKMSEHGRFTWRGYSFTISSIQLCNDFTFYIRTPYSWYCGLILIKDFSISWDRGGSGGAKMGTCNGIVLCSIVRSSSSFILNFNVFQILWEVFLNHRIFMIMILHSFWVKLVTWSLLSTESCTK